MTLTFDLLIPKTVGSENYYCNVTEVRVFV